MIRLTEIKTKKEKREKKHETNMHVVHALLIAIIAILLLGVEACPKKITEGEKGLTMNFVENAPPQSIITGVQFPIYVDITNNGDANIGKEKAIFYLVGVGASLEGVTTRQTNKALLDKGSKERLYFARNALSELELKNPFSLALSLISCHDYGTLTETEICISDKNVSAVCSMGEKIESDSNSIAPVQVTSLGEETIANKLKITFVIENKGITTRKDALNEVYLKNVNCDLLYKRDPLSEYIKELLKKDKVNLRIASPETGFKCDLLESKDGKEGILELSAGTGKVTCEKTFSGEPRKALFTIIADYKYRDSISKTINILPSY